MKDSPFVLGGTKCPNCGGDPLVLFDTTICGKCAMTLDQAMRRSRFRAFLLFVLFLLVTIAACRADTTRTTTITNTRTNGVWLKVWGNNNPDQLHYIPAGTSLPIVFPEYGPGGHPYPTSFLWWYVGTQSGSDGSTDWIRSHVKTVTFYGDGTSAGNCSLDLEAGVDWTTIFWTGFGIMVLPIAVSLLIRQINVARRHTHD